MVSLQQIIYILTMSTFREMIYMCLDRLKMQGDDAYFNEDHVKFLLKKYRASVIKEIIEKKKFEALFMSEIYNQELCVDLEQTYAIDGLPCEGIYLKSTEKIPAILYGLQVYPESYFKATITLVNKDRMKYVGHNKWLKNIIYATIAPDRYLYLTSANPQFMYMEKIKLSAIFDDPEEAYEMQCCNCDSECDPLDASFGIEEAYTPYIMDSVVQALTSAQYQPEDKKNNASDDFADIGLNSAKAAAQKSAYKALNPYKALSSSD